MTEILTPHPVPLPSGERGKVRGGLIIGIYFFLKRMSP